MSAKGGTSDARSRVARRVGDIIVRVLMHDDRRAISVQESLIAAQAYALDEEISSEATAIGHDDIGEITGMSAARQHTVLRSTRVEMPTGRVERRFALSYLVNVDGMTALRQPVDHHFDQHPSARRSG